jgi:hypothetical protein
VERRALLEQTLKLYRSYAACCSKNGNNMAHPVVFFTGIAKAMLLLSCPLAKRAGGKTLYVEW